MGDFHPIVSNEMGSDPPSGVVVSMGGPSTSGIIERSNPLISRALFLIEEFEVEEVPQPPSTPSSPLPASFLDVLLYVGPTSQTPARPDP